MQIRYGQGREIARAGETVDPVEKFKVQGAKIGVRFVDNIRLFGKCG